MNNVPEPSVFRVVFDTRLKKFTAKKYRYAGDSSNGNTYLLSPINKLVIDKSEYVFFLAGEARSCVIEKNRRLVKFANELQSKDFS